jgi:hypothetical protein
MMWDRDSRILVPWPGLAGAWHGRRIVLRNWFLRGHLHSPPRIPCRCLVLAAMPLAGGGLDSNRLLLRPWEPPQELGVESRPPLLRWWHSKNSSQRRQAQRAQKSYPPLLETSLQTRRTTNGASSATSASLLLLFQYRPPSPGSCRPTTACVPTKTVSGKIFFSLASPCVRSCQSRLTSAAINSANEWGKKKTLPV